MRAAANGGITLLFQSTRLVAAVAELGSLGEYASRYQVAEHHNCIRHRDLGGHDMAEESPAT